MTLKFNPPKEEAKNLPRYASYVVGNGMKIHRRVCDAKNSFNNRGWTWEYMGKTEETYGRVRPIRKRVTLHSFILQNVEGDWFVLYEIKPGLTREELPWYKDYFEDHKYGYDSSIYTDSMRESEYYKNRLAEGTAKIVRKAFPMTTDEYVSWRIAVERERLGVS